MNFLGITGMQYSGVPFTNNRILLAEDSNVFTQMVTLRLKEMLGVSVEVCRSFEELQACYEHSPEPVTLAISNINLPGAERVRRWNI